MSSTTRFPLIVENSQYACPVVAMLGLYTAFQNPRMPCDVYLSQWSIINFFLLFAASVLAISATRYSAESIDAAYQAFNLEFDIKKELKVCNNHL